MLAHCRLRSALIAAQVRSSLRVCRYHEVVSSDSIRRCLRSFWMCSLIASRRGVAMAAGRSSVPATATGTGAGARGAGSGAMIGGRLGAGAGAAATGGGEAGALRAAHRASRFRSTVEVTSPPTTAS